MSLAEFWRSTPRILLIAYQAYQRRRAWAAWHSGYPRSKRDADFDDLMGIKRRPKAMTGEEISNVLGDFAARWNKKFEKD